MNKTYDVTIVGGGIVGLTLALALVKNQFSVALIEKNPPIDLASAQSDFRVSAINLASQAIFKSLDIWTQIKPNVSPFEKVCVFEPSKAYAIEFDSAAMRTRYLGFIAEHQLLLRCLAEELSHYPLQYFYQTTVKALEIDAETAKLTLNTGEIVCSRLVVGADGKYSALRELASITMTERDYHQTALVAQVHTEKPHQNVAWQCFRPEGPLAFLPLKQKQSCSLVWSVDPLKAERLQNLSDDCFVVELEAAFEHHLGAVELQSPRFTFPLKMRYVKQFAQPRLALVGDAIHTIHPLAGQGLNLGLMDAARLAEVITHARDKGDDIGDYAILRRYARQRKSHHVAAIAAMEVFKQGFAINVPPLVWLRGRLLHQFNRMNNVKRWCMEIATGTRRQSYDNH